MRLWLKITAWFAGSLVLLLAFLVVFVLGAGDKFHRDVTRRLVEGWIDRKVEVAGGFSLDIGLEPGLVVTDVRIENAPWAEQPEMLRLDRLEVQIAIPPLFSGVVHVRRLVLQGLQVDLETASDGRNNWDIGAPGSDGGGGGDAFYPLLEFIQLEEVTLTYRDARSGWNTKIFLKTLSKQKATADGTMLIEGRGHVNEHPFQIAGRFGSLEDALAASAPYPMALSLEMPGLAVQLDGTAKDLPRAEGFDLALKVELPSVGQLEEVLGLDRVLEGRVELSARLRGDLERLAAENIAFAFVADGGHELRATGTIADLDDARGFDLDLSGRLAPATELIDRLPEVLRDIQGVALAARLTGDAEALKVQDVRVDVTQPNGAALAVSGGLSLDLSGDDVVLKRLDAAATLSLPRSEPFQRALGIGGPPLGPLEASATFSAAADQLSVDSFKLTAAAFGRLELSAEGALGHLSSAGFEFAWDPQLALFVSMKDSRALLSLIDETLPDLGSLQASGLLLHDQGVYRIKTLRAALGSKEALWLQADGEVGPLEPGREVSLQSLALAVDGSWDTTARLAALLGLELPDLGSGSARFKLAGAPSNLAVSDAHLETRRSDGFTLVADGKVARLALTPAFALEGVDFNLRAFAPATAMVSELVGYDIPELGEVIARARLIERGDGHALTEITLFAGPKDVPLLHMNGEIGHLEALGDIDMTGKFGVETQRLLTLAGLDGASGLGDIEGSFELSDADGTLGLESLKIAVSKTDKLALSVEGNFEDIKKGDGLRFQASLSVPDPDALARSLGRAPIGLKAISFNGKLSGNDEAFKFDGDAAVGNTKLTGTFAGSLTDGRPSIQARLHAPLFHFVDFGLVPEPAPPEGAEAPQQDAEAKKDGSERLFGDKPIPFDFLHDFDLDLAIDLDKLEGVSLDVDQAKVRISIHDGVVELDPLAFNLVRGRVEIRGTLDARGGPDIQLDATVDGVDLGEFLGQLDAEVPVDGDFDAILNLTSAGDTLSELASALDGEVSMAVQRGHIRSRAFAFTALDLSSWMFSASTRKGFSELNCFIVRFKIDQGVAKSEMLMLDTSNVRSVGQGTIDLNKETIRIDVDPQPKVSRIAQLTTPFAIAGPLRQPRVEISTSGAAVRTIGEIILTPVNVLGALLPFVSDDGDDEDNPCLDFK